MYSWSASHQAKTSILNRSIWTRNPEFHLRWRSFTFVRVKIHILTFGFHSQSHKAIRNDIFSYCDQGSYGLAKGFAMVAGNISPSLRIDCLDDEINLWFWPRLPKRHLIKCAVKLRISIIYSRCLTLVPSLKIVHHFILGMAYYQHILLFNLLCRCV